MQQGRAFRVEEESASTMPSPSAMVLAAAFSRRSSDRRIHDPHQRRGDGDRWSRSAWRHHAVQIAGAGSGDLLLPLTLDQRHPVAAAAATT